MLIKSSDDKTETLSTLEALLAQAGPDKKKVVEEELWRTRAGIKGEKDAAYLIDFDLKDSKNTAIIHDLRLEIDGRIAQIDHVLIHRTLRVFALETKHFNDGIKITDNGEFLRWSGWKKTFEGMASPLAQNERHIAVLKDAFRKIEMPTRFGVRLTPSLHSVVLVDSKARIDRPKKFDSGQVIKADMLTDYLERNLDQQGAMGALLKLIDEETLEQIARRLVRLHKPATFDYSSKFGIPQSTPNAAAFEPVKAAKPAAPDPSSHPVASTPGSSTPDAPACRGCGSNQLSVQYGKFGYYFKCNACDGNTPIKIGCGMDGHKEKIRKDGVTFFRECADCGTSLIFFENPA